jgi:hypothetical protein
MRHKLIFVNCVICKLQAVVRGGVVDGGKERSCLGVGR